MSPSPTRTPAQGQSASVRLGLGELLELDGVLFCVCDQPWLRRDSVERLTEAGGAEELRDVDEAGTAAAVICVKRTENLRQTDKF